LLREIGGRHAKQPGEVALAWVLANPAVTAAIVGLRNANQIHGTLGALNFRLISGELAEINAFLERKEAVSA
jgi:aryl-alcohol dehydrogenase-like predicted oxidoreductase